jgi:murein DD-endopeptidase MepM/ murein hydrolase activator NlpD
MSLKNNIIVTLLIITAPFLLPGCAYEEVVPAETDHQEEIVTVKPTPGEFLYGIAADTLNLYTGRISRNQFLADILNNFSVSYNEILTLQTNSRGLFDIRKMRAGADYTILTGKTDTTKALYMIYHEDPVNYYILDFTDSIHIRKGEKETRKVMKYRGGTISTSLWNSMVENNISPVLAIDLSEIFAWSIDFFGLQAGDRYKLIYEENYIDTIPAGIHKIYGVWFEHAGNEFYAIPLIQDSTESYFDLEGNSLRKAFLKAPLSYSRISSRFSNSRMHPILRIRRPHHGVDYAAPAGTPVQTIGDGVITAAAWGNGEGYYVKVKHNGVHSTAYLHLSGFAKGVSVGSYVKQGDIIGYVGSTGLSTGPHLDFRFYRNGQPVDPLKVEAPPVEPVSENNREKFARTSLVIKKLLDSIKI